MSHIYSYPPISRSASSSTYSLSPYASDADDDDLLSSSASSFYLSSSASSSTYSLSSCDSDTEDPYSNRKHLNLVFPSPSTEKFQNYDERPSVDKRRPSDPILSGDEIYEKMQEYVDSREALNKLGDAPKSFIANSACAAPDFVFDYLLSRDELFAMMQKDLNGRISSQLAAALKNLINNSDHLAPDFIFALVKPQLERLEKSRGSQRDLLDVLKSLVDKSMESNKWISDPKTSNKLQGIILLYKKKLPYIYSENAPKGMTGIYEAFKEKREAGLTRLRKTVDEGQPQEIHGQQKTYLDKVFDFLDGYYDNAERNPRNTELLTELVAKPLIISAVNFIAAQYIFPSVQRRFRLL